MDLRSYVEGNQEIIQDIKDHLPGDARIDMYFGTLDYATARFNTILLRLSQDKMKMLNFTNDVEDCFQIIQSFYRNVKKYQYSNKLMGMVYAGILHIIGTRKIPKIKILLNRIDN